MRRVTAVAVMLWAVSALAELPVGPQVMHTKDGRELRGEVLSETEQGYLFKMADKTELILFSNIQDLLPAAGAEAPLPPVAPPPPPPPLPPAEGQPVQQHPGTPPPPAGEPIDETPVETAQPVPDWRSERKGFHWSIGAGGMVDPGFLGSTPAGSSIAGFVAAVPSVRWGFGWLDVAAELMPMGYFKGAVKALFMGLNPQLRINFARIFSIGVGIYAAVVFSPGVDFCLGPSFSPSIFRFGSLGEHEVRLWVASPRIATSANFGSVVLMLLSYSYVF